MSTRMLTRILTNVVIGRRKFHTTANLSSLYEPDPKGGFKTVYDRPPDEPDQTFFEKLRHGYQVFKEQFGIFKEEVREHYRMDPISVFRPNEVDVVWQFKGDPKSLDQWVLTCDSDYEHGFSTAK